MASRTEGSGLPGQQGGGLGRDLQAGTEQAKLPMQIFQESVRGEYQRLEFRQREVAGREAVG